MSSQLSGDISTENNVADDVSRGLHFAELTQRWKNGPEFLYLSKENSPIENTKPDLKEVEKECKNVQVVGTVSTSYIVAKCIIDSERFCSWKKARTSYGMGP